MLAKFFGQTAIYGLGALASSGVSFLLLPVYTRHLSPAQYGQLETLNALGQILLIFLAAGLASSFFAVHYRLCQTPDQQQDLLKTTLYLLLTLATSQAAGLFLAAPLAAQWLQMPLGWLWQVIAIQWAAAIGLLPFAISRSRQKAGWFVVLTLCQLGALLGLNIYHVAVLKLGVPGVLRSQLLVYGASALLTIGGVLIRWGPRASFRYAWPLLVWGYTNVPNSLAGWTTNLADRYFLLAHLGASQVGLYAVGYKLGMILHVLLVMPIMIAWAPFLQSIARRPDVARIASETARWVTVLSAVGWVTLGILAEPLVLWVAGAQYLPAAALTPIVLFGYVLAALTPILASGINLAQRYHWFAWVGLASALINVALNAWWIPLWGTLGAAWATVATFGCGAIATWLIAQRMSPVPYPWRAITGWLMVAGATVALGGQLPLVAQKSLLVGAFWLVASTWSYGVISRPGSGYPKWRS